MNAVRIGLCALRFYIIGVKDSIMCKNIVKNGFKLVFAPEFPKNNA